MPRCVNTSLSLLSFSLRLCSAAVFQHVSVDRNRQDDVLCSWASLALSCLSSFVWTWILYASLLLPFVLCSKTAVSLSLSIQLVLLLSSISIDRVSLSFVFLSLYVSFSAEETICHVTFYESPCCICSLLEEPSPHKQRRNSNESGSNSVSHGESNEEEESTEERTKTRSRWKHQIRGGEKEKKW